MNVFHCIVIAVLGSLMYGASAVLCKIGLQYRNQDMPRKTLSDLFLFIAKNRIWITGVALSSLANVLIIQAQAILDVSIVYPILNFAYVFTMLLGYLVLHEILNRAQWIGIAAVTLGTLCILLVQNPVSGGVSTEMEALKTVTVAALCTIVFLIGMMRRSHARNYEIFFAIAAGIAFAEVAVFLKTNTNLVSQHYGYFTIFSLESIRAFFTNWPCVAIFLFSGVGFLCMQCAYSHGNVSVTVPVIAIAQRLMEAPIGYYIFNERFPPLKIAGLTAIVIGGILIIRATIARNRALSMLEAERLMSPSLDNEKMVLAGRRD